MSEERVILSACVVSATTLAPLIIRGCVKAAHSSTVPVAERKRFLNAAINSTTLLLEELKLQRERLGWREDAA